MGSPSTEATVGLEPTVGVLQTPALPLGYVADRLYGRPAGRPFGRPIGHPERYAPFPGRLQRAGEGIRTLDLLLGKETFYH
jgi:hypothetical protein